jgi:acyl-CoA thioester hydrolase
MAPDLGALLADPRIVWTDDVLRFADTDANGHINNTCSRSFARAGG